MGKNKICKYKRWRKKVTQTSEREKIIRKTERNVDMDNWEKRKKFKQKLEIRNWRAKF